MLALLFERITVVPFSDYAHFLESFRNEISDQDDTPHLAACLASNAEGIWAHDPHFLEQDRVKVFTNIDMLRMSGKANEGEK